jgi:carbonic anhydrase/acetyltransferase-like protein (isoleucine patch superfamily)
VHISAIVTIAGGESQAEAEASVTPVRSTSAGSSSQPVLGSPIAFWDVLGHSVLGRTIDRLRRAGITDISVLAEEAGTQFSSVSDACPESSYSTGFWPAWDGIVSRYLGQGTAILLLLRMGTYAEFEISDLVRFHRETASSLTQVCDSRGALDLVLVDGDDLRRSAGSYRKRLSRMISSRRRFRFNGYCKRLSRVADYRSLVQDALRGSCEITPVGSEVRAGVWVGEGAHVDASVMVHGPAYIGAGVRLCDGVTISGESNIEQNTEIDCGTAIEGCSVLPHTYVGVGLRLANAVVAGSKLFHLRRNIEMEIGDERLIGSTEGAMRYAPHDLVRRATSFVSWPRCVAKLSTRSNGTASSMTTRLLEGHG